MNFDTTVSSTENTKKLTIKRCTALRCLVTISMLTLEQGRKSLGGRRIVSQVWVGVWSILYPPKIWLVGNNFAYWSQWIRPESRRHDVDSIDLRPPKSSHVVELARRKSPSTKCISFANKKTSQVVTPASISNNFSFLSWFLIHFLVWK